MADFFNFFVGYGTGGQGPARMEFGRFCEYSDDATIARFMPGGVPDMDALLDLPCLFLPELASCGTRSTKVGRVSNIRRMRGGRRDELHFHVHYDDDLPPLDCETPWAARDAFGTNLGPPNDFQRYHSNWNVIPGNLHQLLLRHLPIRRYGGGVLNVPLTDNTEDDLVAVMMPFDAAFEQTYESIQVAADEVGMRCIRADDIWRENVIMNEVVRIITEARVVVADVTGRNPNVFYETGIAHTLGKEVVLLTQSEQDVPFDVRHIRHQRYLPNTEGLAELQNNLADRLATLTGRRRVARLFPA